MAVERHITAAENGGPVFIGTAQTISFEVYDDDGETPIDVSTWALSFVVRASVKSDDTIIEKTNTPSPSPITVSGEDDNIITVQLEKIDTYDLDASPPVEARRGRYKYTLQRTDAGDETVLFYGDFELAQGTVR